MVISSYPQGREPVNLELLITYLILSAAGIGAAFGEFCLSRKKFSWRLMFGLALFGAIGGNASVELLMLSDWAKPIFMNNVPAKAGVVFFFCWGAPHAPDIKDWAVSKLGLVLDVISKIRNIDRGGPQ